MNRKDLNVILLALAFLGLAASFLAIARSRPEALAVATPVFVLVLVPFALTAVRAFERFMLAQERLAGQNLFALARHCLADWFLSPEEIERFHEQETRRALPGYLLGALILGGLAGLVAVPALEMWAALIPLVLCNLAPRAVAVASRRKAARWARSGRRVCIGRRGAYVGGEYVQWFDDEAEPPESLIEGVRLVGGQAPFLAVEVRSGRAVVPHRLPVPHDAHEQANWVANVLRQSMARR